MQLDDGRAGRAQPLFGRAEQAPVETEAVAGSEDGVLGVGAKIGIAITIVSGQVREVGDDQVELAGHRREEVAPDDMHAIADAEAVSVGAREQDRGRADVGRPDLRSGSGESEADRDRARAGTDVGEARRPVTDTLGGGGDQLLALVSASPEKRTCPTPTLCRRRVRSYLS